MSEENEKAQLSAMTDERNTTHSRLEVKELFAAYEKADEAWEKSKAETDKRFRSRSDACQAICDALGKGPFEYKGQELTITKRGATFFFRGKKQNSSVLKVD